MEKSGRFLSLFCFIRIKSCAYNYAKPHIARLFRAFRRNFVGEYVIHAVLVSPKIIEKFAAICCHKFLSVLLNKYEQSVIVCASERKLGELKS